MNRYQSALHYVCVLCLKKSASLLSLLVSATLLIGCDSDSEDTVTFDGVILLQPELIKDASPEVRSNLQRTVSYGTDISVPAETETIPNEVGIEQATDAGSSIDVITSSDLPVALDPDTSYQVRIQWEYLSEPNNPIRIGSAMYGFMTNMQGNPIENTNLNSPPGLESYVGGGNPNDADNDGLSNLAELNSLDGSDVVAVSDPDMPVMGGGAINADVVVSASTTTIDYDTELSAIWGTTGPLILTSDSDVFEGVSWRAIYRNNEVFIQVTNSDADRSPFENNIRISFVDEMNNSMSPVELSSNALIQPGNVDDFGAANIPYAYRLSGSRIDYRQTLTTPIAENAVRMLNIEFFDSMASATAPPPIASWSGLVAFAGGVIDVAAQSEIRLDVLNRMGAVQDPQQLGGWDECTEFRVNAQFLPDISSAEVTYSWTSASHPVIDSQLGDENPIDFMLPARVIGIENFQLMLNAIVNPQNGMSYEISASVPILYSEDNEQGCE